jgi:hypothetical protein
MKENMIVECYSLPLLSWLTPGSHAEARKSKEMHRSARKLQKAVPHTTMHHTLEKAI